MQHIYLPSLQKITYNKPNMYIVTLTNLNNGNYRIASLHLHSYINPILLIFD